MSLSNTIHFSSYTGNGRPPTCGHFHSTIYRKGGKKQAFKIAYLKILTHYEINASNYSNKNKNKNSKTQQKQYAISPVQKGDYCADT